MSEGGPEGAKKVQGRQEVLGVGASCCGGSEARMECRVCLGRDKVLRERRKCWGSEGGAGGVEEVLGEWRRCKGE